MLYVYIQEAKWGKGSLLARTGGSSGDRAGSTFYNEVDSMIDLSERVVLQGLTTPRDSKEVSMDEIQRNPNPHLPN